MRQRFYQIFIIFILGVCYSLTLAQDLTWAHFSADGGDLITATFVNGVPHSSGYPLYLILAKLFQLLPFGTLAFRTNFFSAVCTIYASLLLFKLIRKELQETLFHNQLALLGALAYGLAPAVWGQALVTEVYALHGLLVILCLYIFLQPVFPEWTRGFVFGLAACNHVTSVFLFPLLFLYGDRIKIALRFTGVLSGLVLYLTLPLRALANPPINWGDSSTLQGFFWLVSGAAYRDYVFQLSFADVIERLRATAGFAIDQFSVLGLLLAIYGLLSLRPSRLLFATLWPSLIFMLFSVVYASYDSHVYLIVFWLCIAVWIPFGLRDILQAIHSRMPRTAQVVSFGMVALLLIRVPFTFSKVDLSKDTEAQQFIMSSLDEIPEGALVFATGDEQVFSLWYARFALQNRKDITIIAEGLLQYEWYNKNLIYTYPLLDIPEKTSLQPFDLITANPTRRVCYISPDDIECP